MEGQEDLTTGSVQFKRGRRWSTGTVQIAPVEVAKLKKPSARNITERKYIRAKQKEVLQRIRPELLRILSVHDVLPALRDAGHISPKDEVTIITDVSTQPRRKSSIDLQAIAALKDAGFLSSKDKTMGTTSRRKLSLDFSKFQSLKISSGSFSPNKAKARKPIEDALTSDQAAKEEKSEEEEEEESEERRMEKVVKLLDFVEKNRDDVYDDFVNCLRERYHHVFVIMSGLGEGSSDVPVGTFGPGAGKPQTGRRKSLSELLATVDEDDERNREKWAQIEAARDQILSEVSVHKIGPSLVRRAIVTKEELEKCKKYGSQEKQTDELLDLLEKKSGLDVAGLIDIIGECYPHLYFKLSGDSSLDDL